MQRLQAWFMPGLACFTLSVAIMKLATGEEFQKMAYVLMAIGSLLIISGAFVEWAWPGLTWHLGCRGKFDRAIRQRLKMAKRILEQQELDYESWRKWQKETIDVLSGYMGGEWHPEIARLGITGGYYYEDQQLFRSIGSDNRKSQLVRQLIMLNNFRKTLRYWRESPIFVTET